MGLRTGSIAALAALAVLVLPGLASAVPPPSDPMYPQQNALKIIRLPQAMAALGPLQPQDVRVGVFDTGLDLDHPDFASRLVDVPASTLVRDSYNGTGPHAVGPGTHGWDFLGSAHNGYGPPPTVTPDNDPTDPVDGTSHGSAVSGILGAAWNDQGGAGVARNARFVAMRTCWDDDQCYQSVQPAAVQYAKDLHVQVVSMSWLADNQDFIDGGYRDAIKNAPQILFVAIPSGNGGATDAQPDAAARAPCNYDAPGDNVICVSTSSPSDGLDCGDYGATLVDIAVPTQENVFPVNGGGFAPTGCATSFAAPTLAGAATVLFGMDTTATPKDVKAALIDSARPVAAWAGKSRSGGILDLEGAVKLFAQRRGITLTPDPSTGPTGTTGPNGSTVPNGSTGPKPGAKDRQAPRLSIALALSRFKAKNGISLRTTLSEPAAISLTIRRRLAGRRVKRRCVAPTRKNRGKPSCTRTRPVRSLTIRGLLVGPNRRVIPASAGRRKLLQPGHYAITVVAHDAAGNRSSSRTARFTILKP